MKYTYTPQCVCSKLMELELDDNNIITDLTIIAGCSGNSQGISALVKGMDAEEAIRRLSGIRCGHKDTSCPDQLAIALTAALAQRRTKTT